jgi:hypothetical protein
MNDRSGDQHDLQADSKDQLSFERQSQMKPPGILSEFGDFLIHNQRWWLTPIIIILLLMSVIIALTNTAIGPFIYALF